MWYDTCPFICGASLGVIETLRNYPWRPFKNSMIVSILVSGSSLTLSGLGGASGVWSIKKGTGGDAVWVAVIACTILFIANSGVFILKIVASCRRKRAAKRWTLKRTPHGYAECLEYGNVDELKNVQITQWLICSCLRETIPESW
jgi:hypothetical protein